MPGSHDISEEASAAPVAAEALAASGMTTGEKRGAERSSGFSSASARDGAKAAEFSGSAARGAESFVASDHRSADFNVRGRGAEDRAQIEPRGLAGGIGAASIRGIEVEALASTGIAAEAGAPAAADIRAGRASMGSFREGAAARGVPVPGPAGEGAYGDAAIGDDSGWNALRDDAYRAGDGSIGFAPDLTGRSKAEGAFSSPQAGISEGVNRDRLADAGVRAVDPGLAGQVGGDPTRGMPTPTVGGRSIASKLFTASREGAKAAVAAEFRHGAAEGNTAAATTLAATSGASVIRELRRNGARAALAKGAGGASRAALRGTLDDENAVPDIVEAGINVRKGAGIARSAATRAYRSDPVQRMRMWRRSRKVAEGVKSGKVVRDMSAVQKASAMTRAAAGGAGTGSAGGIFAALLSPVGMAIVVVLALVIIMGGSGSAADSQAGSLTGNEAVIATFLKEKGLKDAQAASVMGNIYAESGYNPDAVNSGSGAFGICQWLGGRRDALEAYAESAGSPASDLGVQLGYLWTELTGSAWTSSADWPRFLGYTDESDIDDATEFFCKRFERCSSLEFEQSIGKRTAEAHRVFDALQGGRGQDYRTATDAQKAVVDAAHATPTSGPGLCAAWVWNVFASVGNAPQGSLPYASSYMKWCPDHALQTELKVGMIVVVPSTTSSPGIGHIGIYIGDGQIMSSETAGGRGYIKARPVAEWCSIFCTISPAYAGWINGIDLSQQ